MRQLKSKDFAIHEQVEHLLHTRHCTRLCETQAEMCQDSLGIRNQVEEISKKKKKAHVSFYFKSDFQAVID